MLEKSINLSNVIFELFGIKLTDDIAINGLNLCNRNTEKTSILSYATKIDYLENVIKNTSIKALIVPDFEISLYKEKLASKDIALVPHEFPEWAFYDVHDYLADKTDFYNIYDFSKVLGKNCSIHPSAIIEDGVTIGNNVTIGANTIIGSGSVLCDGVKIGKNSTIASEGFQIIRKNFVNRQVRHFGGLYIDSDTCIGDNVCVCRSLFEGNTYVGKNVMIDNLSYIAHNCHIDDNAVITAGVMLCGSSKVERGAWIGVNSSVLNRVVVEENAMVGIGSVVTRNIDKNTVAYGVPAKKRLKSN